MCLKTSMSSRNSEDFIVKKTRPKKPQEMGPASGVALKGGDGLPGERGRKGTQGPAGGEGLARPQARWPSNTYVTEMTGQMWQNADRCVKLNKAMLCTLLLLSVH